MEINFFLNKNMQLINTDDLTESTWQTFHQIKLSPTHDTAKSYFY